MNFVYALAIMVISYAITALTTPRPQNAQPAQFTDFALPVPDEGTPQGVTFGDCWVENWQVLWYGNLQTGAIKASGGKK